MENLLYFGNGTKRSKYYFFFNLKILTTSIFRRFSFLFLFIFIHWLSYTFILYIMLAIA